MNKNGEFNHAYIPLPTIHLKKRFAIYQTWCQLLINKTIHFQMLCLFTIGNLNRNQVFRMLRRAQFVLGLDTGLAEYIKHTVYFVPFLSPTYIPSSLWYKSHLSWQLNSWSHRCTCSWSIACRRCSNYILMLNLTHCFNRLGKDNCKTGRESLTF